jgi:hypothetical protein
VFGGEQPACVGEVDARVDLTLGQARQLGAEVADGGACGPDEDAVPADPPGGVEIDDGQPDLDDLSSPPAPTMPRG